MAARLVAQLHNKAFSSLRIGSQFFFSLSSVLLGDLLTSPKSELLHMAAAVVSGSNGLDAQLRRMTLTMRDRMDSVPDMTRDGLHEFGRLVGRGEEGSLDRRTPRQR